MELFESASLAELYPRLCAAALIRGEDVAPREQKTKELLDVTIQLNDPTDVLLPRAINRVGYRPAIGAAEGLLLVAGLSDPGLLARISRVFNNFADGGAFHGAYGPRVRFQLPRMIARLADDPNTRQAVATIWDPLYDGAEPAQSTPLDLPCTVYLNFRIRNGQLTLKTHMRSNDLWLGLPYDAIQFTLLQATVANVLGVPVGPYVHHVDSLHLYERHWNAADDVGYTTGGGSTTVRTTLTGLGARSWPEARLIANDLLYDGTSWRREHYPTEAYLNELLSPYREDKIS